VQVKDVREGGVELLSIGSDGRVGPGLEAGDLPFEFWGGYVGYLGYELKDDCLRLQRADSSAFDGPRREPAPAPTPSLLRPDAGARDVPDAMLVYADRVLVFDHQEGEVFAAVVTGEGEGGEEEGLGWVARVEEALGGPGGPAATEGGEEAGIGAAATFEPLVSPSEYKTRVDRCMELIRQGETYEVCLTSQVGQGSPG
jgi:para-aminobenzoate synthetase